MVATKGLGWSSVMVAVGLCVLGDGGFVGVDE